MFKRIVLAFGLYLSIIASLSAQQKNHPFAADLQVDSESLGSIVLDKKVKLMMRDGSYLEGRVLQASREEIVLHVGKAEQRGDSVLMRKGKEASLKTSDIGVVYLRKDGAVAAPVALGVLGGFLGALGTSYALRNSENNGTAFTLFVAGTAGGATAGALLGREAVKKAVTIYVTPTGH
jgi:hypothetical protein